MVGVVAATLWGGGFIIGSVGIATHQLWLVYLGYGVFGGFASVWAMFLRFLH